MLYRKWQNHLVVPVEDLRDRDINQIQKADLQARIERRRALEASAPGVDAASPRTDVTDITATATITIGTKDNNAEESNGFSEREMTAVVGASVDVAFTSTDGAEAAEVRGGDTTGKAYPVAHLAWPAHVDDEGSTKVGDDDGKARDATSEESDGNRSEDGSESPRTYRQDPQPTWGGPQPSWPGPSPSPWTGPAPAWRSPPPSPTPGPAPWPSQGPAHHATCDNCKVSGYVIVA